MSNNLEILPLFSSPVGTTLLDYEDNATSILDTLEFARIEYPVGSGFCSKEKYVLRKPEFKYLYNIIFSQVNHYLKNQLGLFKDNEFKIANSWVMKYTKGNAVHPHNHNNSLFSGILYTSVDNMCGSLTFTTPNRNSGIFLNMTVRVYSELNNIFTAEQWEIKPKNKLLVIFPSYLAHQVSPSESDNIKTSLAFNIIPTKINYNSFEELSLS